MFNFNIDRRTIYILIAVLVVIGIMNFENADLLALFLSLPGVIIAMTFHEFAHAFVAYKLGDNTPKYQGRLTLNPLSHIDPFGLIMLVFAHIGWGKPVQIDSRNFNGKHSLSASEAIVAVAGPVMNFIIALIFALILGAISKVAPISFLTDNLGSIICEIIYFVIVINIGLGVFNLIPLPPLDGSKVLMHFLPYNGKVWMSNNSGLFSIIFLAIWITGAANYIVAPAINWVYSGIMNIVQLIF